MPIIVMMFTLTWKRQGAVYCLTVSSGTHWNHQADSQLLPHYAFFHYRQNIFNFFHLVLLLQDLSKSKCMGRSKNDGISSANSKFEWLNGVNIISSLFLFFWMPVSLFLAVLSDMDCFSSWGPLQNNRGGKGIRCAGSPTLCPLLLGFNPRVGCLK